jgi:hypothetical protein
MPINIGDLRLLVYIAGDAATRLTVCKRSALRFTSPDTPLQDRGVIVLSIPIHTSQDWRRVMGCFADLGLTGPDYVWFVENTSQILTDLFRLP